MKTLSLKYFFFRFYRGEGARSLHLPRSFLKVCVVVHCNTDVSSLNYCPLGRVICFWQVFLTLMTVTRLSLDTNGHTQEYIAKSSGSVR